MANRTLVPAILSLLALAACGPATEESETSSTDAPVADHRGDIDWVDGTVEEAFALAKELDKPLFLYWGAIWCPPCHYLKEKIFKQPEFVEKSRKFVAVYLDGDTDRAQEWGERLGAAGYPTVLVLDPDGNEVMRMTSGIPVEEYTGVLAAALASMRPIKEVLDGVLEVGVDQAEAADLELLANYSWAQDASLELSDEAKLEIFRALYEGTPATRPVEKSKFLAHYLDTASRTPSEGRDGPAVSDEERMALRDAVLGLLADRDLRNSNVFFIAISGPPVAALLDPEPGADRDEVLEAWNAAAAAMEEDAALSNADRLYAVNARVQMVRSQMPPVEGVADLPPLPEELVDHVRTRIAEIDAEISGPGELQSALNVMAGLMVNAGLVAEAKELVSRRMSETLVPHYYMSWMVDFEEGEDDIDGALAWSRRAYDESEGPYTRFQWGAGYLRDLMRLAPEDTGTIEEASSEVLSELLALDDAFANRNWTRWQGLEQAFRVWGEDGRGDAVARIRDTVLAACDRFAEGGGEDSARIRCDGFLDDEAA